MFAFTPDIGTTAMHVNPALPLCWAGGVLRPSAEFRPSLHDRSFRYGDGVFATLALEDGVLLDAEAHVRKLVAAATAIGLETPGPVRTAAALGNIIAQLGADSGTSATVRIQVSAAPGSRGYGRARSGASELVELFPVPRPRALALAVLENGRVPAPALPDIKSCSALVHVLCAREAAQRGCEEALRVDGDHVLEASSANVFWQVGGELFTPAASLPLYPGCTRARVIGTARSLGWTVHEGTFTPADLDAAEAAFLTNAARGIEPVRELDGRPLEWAAALDDLRVSVASARREAGTRIAPGTG